MKRLIAILLCMVLLSGCTAVQEPVPTQTDVTETQAPKPVSLYDSGNPVEQQTEGAVRAYPLGEGAYRALLPMGDTMVAVSADGILTAIRGKAGEVTATGMADISRDWENDHMIATPQGILYFARESREVVSLDLHLQQVQRYPLPKDSQGDPLLQGSGQVFYCVANQIRGLDLQTGVSRLVREHSYETQTLTGSYFEDTVIGCRVEDESGKEQTLYLLSKTGEEVRRDEEGFVLQTWGQAFFAGAPTEPAQYVFGNLTGEPMCLYPQETEVKGIPEQNAAVGITAGETGMTLSYYDLLSGKRTAEVTLPGIESFTAMAGDREAVWFLADSTLYRWEVTDAAVGDETVYTDVRYTEENPDMAGIAACQEQVQRLRETYGLELYIWEDATYPTKEYGTKPEYRVSVLQDSLNAIERLLQKFPADFLKTTGSTAFYLVASLESGEPAAQYWNGAMSCVVLDTGSVEESFLWGLGFGVDTRVLGNSRDFDTWDELNPRGFQYTYDYEDNAKREDAEKYQHAFVNQRAMSFPTEDRSFIFAYAILPEGGELFAEKAMQKKLVRMCEAIREAYGLEDSPEVFLWEQYLEVPLAKEA